MDPKNVRTPDLNSHWDRAAMATDSDIKAILDTLYARNPGLQSEEVRDKYRPAIAALYGTAGDATWEQIKEVALEKWRWAIEQGVENGWDFARIKEAFYRGDHHDRSLQAGLEFDAGLPALADFWASRVRELDEKLRENQKTIDQKGGELKALKVELIGKFHLDPNTPILDVFDRADSALGTTIVADLLAGITLTLKEAGKVSPDAEYAEIRAAAAELFSKL